MSNPLDPREMTDGERISELADILAAGLLRARTRQTQRLAVRREFREVSLDNPGQTIPHRLEPQPHGESL
jgi:hypothetical protein